MPPESDSAALLEQLLLQVDVVNSELLRLSRQPMALTQEQCLLLRRLRERFDHGRRLLMWLEK